MTALALRDIRKNYGQIPVVHGINLDIKDGEFIVLVGPSGCGKSTLLRMIAGLEEISGGDLLLNGERINELPPQKRGIAMVFQSYALYPHLSVYDNIAFGPRLRHEPETSFKPRIEKAAEMLNLTPYLERLPKALSGGQRQRVAMARAVVREPTLFLFDEPLSNLDAKLRLQMRTEIKALHQRLKNTIVYVTHDQIEAMTLADRIVVMNSGRIEQVGTPLELYDKPANLFVAGFLGSPAMNFIQGTVVQQNNQRMIDLGEGVLLPTTLSTLTVGQTITLGIRPSDIQVVEQSPLQLKINLMEVTGSETIIYGTMHGSIICLSSYQRLAAQPNGQLPITWSASHVHVFDTSTGERISTGY